MVIVGLCLTYLPGPEKGYVLRVVWACPLLPSQPYLFAVLGKVQAMLSVSACNNVQAIVKCTEVLRAEWWTQSTDPGVLILGKYLHAQLSPSIVKSIAETNHCATYLGL